MLFLPAEIFVGIVVSEASCFRWGCVEGMIFVKFVIFSVLFLKCSLLGQTFLVSFRRYLELCAFVSCVCLHRGAGGQNKNKSVSAVFEPSNHRVSVREKSRGKPAARLR